MQNLPTRGFSHRGTFFFLFLFVALSFSFVFSLTLETLPRPAQEVKAFDTPNDGGGSITITWKMSPDDKDGLRSVTGYEVLRSSSLEGEYISVGSVDAGEERFVDTLAVNGIEYYYKVRTKSDVAVVDSPASNPVKAKVQFFNLGKLNVLVGLALLSCFILFSIFWARKGKEVYVRPIAGLKAIDEAIGRATEMGKAVLFIPGIHDIDAPGTLAGMSILGRVAEKTAEYGTPLLVPCRHAMAMSLARQVVRESHMRVGHPETYKEDNISFLTTEQFGYVAGVDGIMVREKPAANFYLGDFFAESLIFAETGYSTGAIQIAGTPMIDQLPFFVAACDYTLIGEELYTAGAVLSKDPIQLGSLKGQDLGKVVFILIVVVGVLLATLGVGFFSNWFIVQ